MTDLHYVIPNIVAQLELNGYDEDKLPKHLVFVISVISVHSVYCNILYIQFSHKNMLYYQ